MTGSQFACIGGDGLAGSQACSTGCIGGNPTCFACIGSNELAGLQYRLAGSHSSLKVVAMGSHARNTGSHARSLLALVATGSHACIRLCFSWGTLGYRGQMKYKIHNPRSLRVGLCKENCLLPLFSFPYLTYLPSLSSFSSLFFLPPLFFFWILVLIRLRRIKNSRSHRYQKSA